ncbi:hypothetical protein GE061_016756 [Apolygus lucorum]|uniref:Uncharacterized protein n=1 Tax=Apolygus lucorum TaxID=248454 RepID=A0A8S9XH22_APOLU|nr:hypothetical protein GE061_016756 [Apolygus lucorum]
MSAFDSNDEEEIGLLMEGGVRPKNENYLRDTVSQYTDTQFREYFCLSRGFAAYLTQIYEASPAYQENSTGGNGKLGAYEQSSTIRSRSGTPEDKLQTPRFDKFSRGCPPTEQHSPQVSATGSQPGDLQVPPDPVQKPEVRKTSDLPLPDVLSPPHQAIPTANDSAIPDDGTVTFHQPLPVAVLKLPHHLQRKHLAEWTNKEIAEELGNLSDDSEDDSIDDDLECEGGSDSEFESDYDDTICEMTFPSNQIPTVSPVLGETFSWPKKRKKVGRKENAVKKMKVEGCEHVNHVGKRVPAKQIGPDCKKAEAFYQKKRLYKQQARQGLVTVITFDFMQNLPLPHLQTNAIFYARQLWFYVFGIHELANDDACMYTYHEGVAKRGQNEVTSFLFDYLKTKQDLKDHLVLISDG